MFLFVLNKMLSAKNYILYLIALLAILILLVFTFGNVVFEEKKSISGILLSILMFNFFELVTIALLGRKSKNIAPRKSVNLLLGIKTAKILLVLLYVAVYALAVKVETQRFLMVFLAIYLIYLFSNTIYLTRREKQQKANHTNL